MTLGGSRKRVLVVVLAMDAEPWRRIELEGQRKTWAASPVVPVFYLYGRSGKITSTVARCVQRGVQRFAAPRVFSLYSQSVGSWFAGRKVRVNGDRVATSVPETYLNTNPKNIAGLRYLLATQEFDYVFRTNSSSYVHLPALWEYVQNLPNNGYYAGFIGHSGGIPYASGTCILMSRDTVEIAVNDPAWEYDLIDDVALGRSMARASVEVQPLTRLDVLTQEDLDALSLEALTGAFVVRCKGLGSRDHDIAAMHRVHALYGAPAS